MAPKKGSTIAGSKTGRRVPRKEADDVEDEVAELAAGKEKAGSPRAKVPRGGTRAERDEPDSRPNVKFRLGKRWSQIITEVKDGQYTWDEFAEELDSEELARGQLKDRNGRFQGRPPALVPKAFHDALIREIHRRFNEKMQARLLEATDELISLSQSGGGLEPKDRAKVLTYLIERVMGPVPKEVKVTAAHSFEEGVSGLLRPAVDGSPASAPRRPDRYAKRRAAMDADEDQDD